MTRQAKIGVTLASLLLLSSLFTVDALVVERSLTSDVLGWEDVSDVQHPSSFEHVMDVTAQQGFSMLLTPDVGFLSNVLPGDLPRQRAILLKDGDRAAFVEWIQSEDAERYFLILKTVLHQSFSERVEGVEDEIWDAGVRVLKFHDPALSEEWFIFVQLKDQLLEFRIPAMMLDHIHLLLTAIISSFE